MKLTLHVLMDQQTQNNLMNSQIGQALKRFAQEFDELKV